MSNVEIISRLILEYFKTTLRLLIDFCQAQPQLKSTSTQPKQVYSLQNIGFVQSKNFLLLKFGCNYSGIYLTPSCLT